MRHLLGEILLLTGALIFLAVGNIYLRFQLAVEKPVEPTYLTSSVNIGLPLPTPVGTESALAESTTSAPADNGVTDTARSQLPIAFGPVVRLTVPLIGIDQSVVPVSIIDGAKGAAAWDTDALFATESRRDLVGQLAISLNPGEGGNIILVGHNYDMGRFNWEGIFYHLEMIAPGNKVILYTLGGGEYSYIVQSVNKVPAANQAKQEEFLWPTPQEQVTLVTCSGPNFGRWSFRIYVVATPENK